MRLISLTESNSEGVSLLDIAGAVAGAAREALPLMWIEWKRINRYPGDLEPASRDVCVPTAFALRDALRRTIPEVAWRVVGGRPTKRTPNGGFVDASGRSHPHLWVVGRCTEGEAVVDITGDQFAGDPVVASVAVADRYVSNASDKLLRRYEANEAVTVEMFLLAIDHAVRSQPSTI